MPDTPSLQRRIQEFFSGRAPVRVFFAPGRINIIGEHLDYNGGCVLPAAIPLGITGLIQDRDDRLVRIASEQAPGEVLADLDRSIEHSAAPWADYPLGAIRFLLEEGLALERGKNILFSSTLPQGAGLSSSAALEVLTAFMLSDDSRETEEDLLRIARLMSAMENEWIGVRCGIMDQFTVALARKGHALLLDSGTMEYRHVPLPDDGGLSLVIMNSNRARELADSKYNERRAECEEALSRIRKRKGGPAALALADHADLDLLPEGPIRKRARHVISEQRRVLEAAAALRRGDQARLGSLLSESHRSLRDDYEVTGSELDALVRAAESRPECRGARMTGAGFGGCAIALVSGDETRRFMDSVRESYLKATGRTADFYRFTPENGVHEVTSIDQRRQTGR